ncbi:hypothetical protein MXB_825 [Myxobolus squamalis]|nr:hypothetical protein MXB_825 [Myxobolus squamalis]
MKHLILSGSTIYQKKMLYIQNWNYEKMIIL